MLHINPQDKLQSETIDIKKQKYFHDFLYKTHFMYWRFILTDIHREKKIPLQRENKRGFSKLSQKHWIENLLAANQ